MAVSDTRRVVDKLAGALLTPDFWTRLGNMICKMYSLVYKSDPTSALHKISYDFCKACFAKFPHDFGQDLAELWAKCI